MKKQWIVIFVFLITCFSLLAQSSTDFEIPISNSAGQLVKHLGYTLWYNEEHEQAAWVVYELTAAETYKNAKRSNKFRPDEAVKTGSANNADYLHSGYDRGHLAPAADMSWSVGAISESFFYSNMSPQVPAFNRGIWKNLEELMHKWAVENDAIYIVTGPVLEPKLPSIGHNKVSVPRYYYKVILDYRLPCRKGIAFLMPNAASSQALQEFAVPIDSVEHVTGINFFPKLSAQEEKELEASCCIPCWNWRRNTTHRKH